VATKRHQKQRKKSSGIAAKSIGKKAASEIMAHQRQRQRNSIIWRSVYDAHQRESSGASISNRGVARRGEISDA